MKTPEGQLKDRIRAVLKASGSYYNMPVPSGYGVPMLDFVCCYRGRFFMVETKSPGSKPTARQQKTMADVKAAGGEVFWGSDYLELRKQLADFFVRVDSDAEHICLAIPEWPT
jgi:hypothetical protein